MRGRDQRGTTPDIGILAGRLLFSLQKELFETLAEQGHPGLRPRHGAVLAYLDEEGTRATELSVRSGQHKQIIGTLVDELSALGYVERVPDPKDRRAKLVVPTELGLDQMAKADAIISAIERRHAEAVGAEEFATFKQVFHQIAEASRRSR